MNEYLNVKKLTFFELIAIPLMVADGHRGLHSKQRTGPYEIQ